MKLPTVDLAPARGARPSQATVRPTDLGLGEAARSVDAWAAEVEETRGLEELVAREEAEKTVAPILSAFETAADAEFNQAGAEWDGLTPGFARGAQSRLAERRAGFGGELPLTPLERDALERGLNRHTEATGQRAIQYESQRRGAVAVEAAAARQGAAVAGLTGEYMRSFGEAQQELDNTFDGSTDDYEAQALANHDAAADDILSRTPDALRAKVLQMLTNQRLQVQGRSMDVQARGTSAFITSRVRQAGDNALNGLQSNPAMYEQYIAGLDDMVSALPANVRGVERSRLLDAGTEVMVQGLILNDQPERALELLNGGTLDARLQPGTKARLLETAVRKRDEPDPADIVSQVQADILARDNLASIAATGMPIEGADPATLSGAMSPAELARYTLAVEEAKRTHAALPGFDGMSAAEINAHVAGLAPEPGTPGYAEAQQRYGQAQQLAQRTLAARQEDPAAAAQRADPRLGEQIARLGQGDLNSRRRAGAAYAAGQDVLQEEWGISDAQRRVLPKAAATAIVAEAEGAADPGEGLRRLSSVIEAFEPPTGATADQMRAGFIARNRVIAELRAAGADPADIAAAVDLGGDIVRMGRYVAATRGGALGRLEAADRRELNTAVDRELTAYMASFAAAPGSPALTEGRRVMAQRLAAERLAAGGSVRDAAREGVDVVEGGYVYVGQQGWRMPRQLAEARYSGLPGDTAARQGTARLMATLALNNGQGFYTPADNGRGMNAEQRRRRYHDTVRQSGRWFATADDRGLVLMTPTLEGGWTPALSSEGRPVAYSWPQVVQAGAAPSAVNQRSGLDRRGPERALARGLRNNNPGNIEYRAENPWRGQTGSDGRFATFATPAAGLRALAIDLRTKHGRGLRTVRSILSAYAPPSENNTAGYIRAVSGALGVDPSANLDLNDPRVLGGLMGAIVQHENGSQPYDNALIGRIAAENTRRP